MVKKKSSRIEPLEYWPLAVPGVGKALRVTRTGGVQPLVDLRSICECVGVSWLRWEAAMLVAAAQAGVEMRLARDAAGRRTRLAWFGQMPHLLSAIAPVMQTLRPAAARQIKDLRQMWRTRWPAAVAQTAFTQPVTAAIARADSDTAPASGKRSYALIPKVRPPITREVEKQVQDLTAEGLSRAEIGRRLGISAASASLLARGQYKFAQEA